MNIEPMRIRSYCSFKVDDRIPEASAERYSTPRAYGKLLGAGCGEVVALEVDHGHSPGP